MTEEIENTRIYLRNDSLQDALSQLTQAACFLVEGSCRRRLKIVWIILHCKILEFSSQYVCSFATKKSICFDTKLQTNLIDSCVSFVSDSVTSKNAIQIMGDIDIKY